MGSELRGVVVQAADRTGLARFWAQALGWARVADGTGELLRAPAEEGGLRLLFVPESGPKREKNRVHLDLVGGPEEVERLLGLGARRIDIGQGAVPWEILADPEGNEFCVLPREFPRAGRLMQICQDAADQEAQGRFWGAASGWHQLELNEWLVRLGAPDEVGPTLVMGPPAAPKTGPGRWRLAVGPDAAERLALDGSSALVDPEGNEFEVLS